jgi:hypothetical protein
LKKQSQFLDGRIDVNPYVEGYYDKIPLFGARKNKAKQSQSYGSGFRVRGSAVKERKGCLKKQSQFQIEGNERKYLSDKE